MARHGDATLYPSQETENLIEPPKTETTAAKVGRARPPYVIARHGDVTL
jgi:hypothetical protein